MWLGWYDPDKHKPASKKLGEAITRYRGKWGRMPTVALVNQIDFDNLWGIVDVVKLRSVRHVAPNVFFVGEDDGMVTP